MQKRMSEVFHLEKKFQRGIFMGMVFSELLMC